MAGPPSLFLDANVLFSAAHSPEGRGAALFALARKGFCRLSSSGYAVFEAERNLHAKSPGALKALEAMLPIISIVPEAAAETTAKTSISELDAGDVPILAAALAAWAAILVTGDRKHFGRWMGREILGVEIRSIAQTLEVLLGGRGRSPTAPS